MSYVFIKRGHKIMDILKEYTENKIIIYSLNNIYDNKL